MTEAFSEQVEGSFPEEVRFVQTHRLKKTTPGRGRSNGETNSVAPTGIYKLSIASGQNARQPVPHGKSVIIPTGCMQRAHFEVRKVWALDT